MVFLMIALGIALFYLLDKSIGFFDKLEGGLKMIVLLIISIVVFAYLFYALIKPEKF